MTTLPPPIPETDIEERFLFATKMICEAGALAKSYFGRIGELSFEAKGPQDFVSVADIATERYIIERILSHFPDDSILGEESGTRGSGPITWVIDPIDGTFPFSVGMSNWCVVIAILVEGITHRALICDPNADELFAARHGGGATLNGRPIACQTNGNVAKGLVSVGYPKRMLPSDILPVLDRLLAVGGMFHRNGSGALSLCYVAAGRLLGYIEARMYSWDCLAGLLLVREAGGGTTGFNNGESLTDVSRVVAAAPGLFAQFDAILGHSGPETT